MIGRDKKYLLVQLQLYMICQKLFFDLWKVLGVLSEEESSLEMITASNNGF